MSERITIIGAGICGLSTAMSLAGTDREVVLLDRDPAPPEGDADAAFHAWDRRGAAQFRHPHAFLGLMCNLIRDNFPELLQMFYAAGARHLEFEELVPPELRHRYRPLPQDDRVWLLMCRRATMETVMRRYAKQLPGVRIMDKAHVKGLLLSRQQDQIRVRGLTVEQAGQSRDLESDLVIDASGRTSRCKGWLEAAGMPVVEDEATAAEIVYYTRHYRLRPGQEEPPRGEHAAGGDLGYLKFGVFPGDHGTFAIILCLPNQEQALRKAVRDPILFDRICRAIPGLAPWLETERSEAMTEPFGIGDIVSHWRRLVVDGRPLVQDFFAVGDAAIRTNPLYGRGCSIGILHAQILADVLRRVGDSEQRALEFADLTEEKLRPIFDACVREDLNGIKKAQAVYRGEVLDQVRGWNPRKYLALAVRDALAAASRSNMRVFRGASRTFHLLEKPGEFLNEWQIRLIVLAYMLRGRRINLARQLQTGPDRLSMYRELGLAEQSAS